MCKECWIGPSETGYSDLDLLAQVLRHKEKDMCKFPNWDHSEGVYHPDISEQLDAIPDNVLFTEPTDLYEDEDDYGRDITDGDEQ